MSGADARVDDQAYFDEIVTTATSTLVGEEVLLANVAGERTDFIRFNHGDVRQAGTVDQRTLTIDLVEGRKHVGGSIRLSGERSVDDARLATLIARLREQRRLVPDDPYLLYNTEPTSTERVEHGDVPAPDAALADIRHAGKGRDLVGIYASGDTFSGFANSLGQRNWFQSSTFNLDWSFYLRADKAAKKECKTTDAGCKAMKACSDAEKALQEDLAKLEKGVPADQQAAFLKAHQENLKKYFDAKGECKKACAAKGEKSEKEHKSCSHGDKKS